MAGPDTRGRPRTVPRSPREVQRTYRTLPWHRLKKRGCEQEPGGALRLARVEQYSVSIGPFTQGQGPVKFRFAPPFPNATLRNAMLGGTSAQIPSPSLKLARLSVNKLDSPITLIPASPSLSPLNLAVLPTILLSSPLMLKPNCYKILRIASTS